MQHGCFLFVIYLYTNFVSTMHAPPWMYAGDDAEEEKEDIPHFSEDEEETMSQTGRPMTDEEMRAIGLTPAKDDLEDVEVDSTEEDDEEDEGMDGDGYFQKYGVMKPPPCPKPMPQQGGKMRPPEPPGPPPGRAKAEPVPAAAKGPCTVPPPRPPPQGTAPWHRPALQDQRHQLPALLVESSGAWDGTASGDHRGVDQDPEGVPDHSAATTTAAQGGSCSKQQQQQAMRGSGAL